MDPDVKIKIGGTEIEVSLTIPDKSEGLVVFVQGSGGSRMDSINIFIANELNKAGLATLLFDLTSETDAPINETRSDIETLTDRLVGVTKWCRENPKLSDLIIGYLGSGTGAAAALSASAYYGAKIKAVVCRGGRPDLTGEELDLIESPTLLIVGGQDKQLIDLNRQAFSHIGCEKKMELIPGASHYFEEAGALMRVAELTINWFATRLTAEIK